MAQIEPFSDGDILLTPAEVATLFRVNPKTVTRWAKAGRLGSIRTLGGHRRYSNAQVKVRLAEGAEETISPEGAE